MTDEKQMPEEIFLQGDCSTDGDETTWCVDRINDDDTSYTRTDLYTALKEENERLREALGFYADETKYFGIITDKPDGGTLMEWPMYQDGGQRARAALQPDLMGEKE